MSKTIVWVTKYALTRRIPAQEVHEMDGQGYVWIGSGFNRQMFKLGRDCFLNRTDALLDAERRRKKKIESLKNQIERLEDIEFVAEPAGGDEAE